MPLYLHRVRFGFATNSSSTHSIVLLKEDHGVSDSGGGEDFGWDAWTAASTKAKLAWLGQSMRDTLRAFASQFSEGDSADPFMLFAPPVHPLLGEMTLEEQREFFVQLASGAPDPKKLSPAAQVLLDATRENPELGERLSYSSTEPISPNAFTELLLGVSLDPDGYVDHQSSVDLPGPIPPPRLIAQAIAYLTDPRIVIVGGNDNDEVDHPLTSMGEMSPEGRLGPLERFNETGARTTRLRWDLRDGYWSSMDTYRGTVTRWRLAANPGAPIVRAEAPALVDVNITNACTIGCSYCYRGSTPEQAHADPETLGWIFAGLQASGTFEVALGGGEPMDHPQIDRILELGQQAGLVVNITTRRLGWLQDPVLRASRLDRIRGFGLSVDNAASVVRVVNAFLSTDPEFDRNRIGIQVVVGTTSLNDLINIREACITIGVRLVLLGHKTTGRGGERPMYDPNDWAERVFTPDHRDYRPSCAIGVDTVLASVWKNYLTTHAWDGSFESEEGRYSCFIDALGEGGPRLHRCSYDTSNEGIRLVRGQSVIRAFQQMQAHVFGWT